MSKQQYIGPKGGKYSDAAHKHAWTPDKEIAQTSATTGAAGQLFSSALDALKVRHAKAKKAGDKKLAGELDAQIKGAKAGQKPRKRFAGGKLVTEYHGAGVAAGSKEHWPHDVPGPSGAFWAALGHLEAHKGEHDDGNKAKARAVTTEAVKVSKRLRGQAAAAQLDRSKAVRLTSLAQQVEEFGKFALHVSGDAGKPWPQTTPTKAPRRAPEGQHDLFGGPAPEKPEEKTRTASGPAQLGLFGKALAKAQLDLFGGGHKTHAQHGGPFVGPRGGKWADAKHTIPWKETQESGKTVDGGTRPAHTTRMDTTHKTKEAVEAAARHKEHTAEYERLKDGPTRAHGLAAEEHRSAAEMFARIAVGRGITDEYRQGAERQSKLAHGAFDRFTAAHAERIAEKQALVDGLFAARTLDEAKAGLLKQHLVVRGGNKVTINGDPYKLQKRGDGYELKPFPNVPALPEPSAP